MQAFYNSFMEIISYIAGESLTLKPLTVLSSEIVGLIGTEGWSWISYFLVPVNLLSLFVQGSMVYASCWLLLFLPWRLFRKLIGFSPERKVIRK
ncbi:MAG: hypothetical protein IJ009_07750 [Clostridia bacterium]|nr:hypothetical protein [Clostridia bacterium]